MEIIRINPQLKSKRHYSRELIKVKENNKTRISGMKKIWIGLDNSPHVILFEPIIEELQKHGFKIVLTSRDCTQVFGLAR